jgi:alkylation response protein AidB-like acyl-CoA dehydrogenase
VSPLLTTLYTTAGARRRGRPRRPRCSAVELADAQNAVTNAEGSWAPGDSDVSATAAGRAVELNGTASFVQDARKVPWFVVSASGPAGVGLFAVDADAPGVTIQPDHIVDLTRDQARGVPAHRRVGRARHRGAGSWCRCAGGPAYAAHGHRGRHVQRR